MEEIFEAIKNGNFSQLMIDTKPQIQESQRIPSAIYIYICISYLNCKKVRDKEEILKEAREGGDKLPVLEQGSELRWTTTQKPCKNRVE